jgi:hypothetical protein
MNLKAPSVVFAAALATAAFAAACSSSSSSGTNTNPQHDSGTPPEDGNSPLPETGTGDTSVPMMDSAVPVDTGTPDTGTEAGSDGGGGYGTLCTTISANSPQCTVAPYVACQMIMMKDICTKPCTTAADCPDPPTGGSCNAMGYCK